MVEKQQDDDLLVNVPPEPPKETPIPTLLRPHEVEEKREELRRLEGILTGPAHVKEHIDIGALNRQVTHIKRDLERGVPRPYEGRQLDRAAKREAALRDELSRAMPSQETMRRNPPGAVDAHRAFERDYKRKVQEWKMLRLRLQASGSGEGNDVANLEMYRRRETGGTRGMDAQGTQITGKNFYFPAGGVQVGNVASDEDKDRMRQETAALLAAQAASGDKGAMAALQRFIGDDVEVSNDGKGGLEFRPKPDKEVAARKGS